jgi:hypothetical protein
MALNYTLENTSDLVEQVVFTDANVIIYRYWLSTCQDKIAKQYKKAFIRLQKQNTRLVTNMATLTEVANRVFHER